VHARSLPLWLCQCGHHELAERLISRVPPGRRRRTEHRFELTLSDPNIIGMRRAAQRILGAAQKKAAEMAEKPTDDVTPLLEAELTAMAQA